MSDNVRTSIGHRLKVWADYLKIEHTLFSVPLIYAGALLAEPPLTLRTAVLILVAATGARTTALGLNRILDRHLDAQNPRTANRALPAGAISLRGAVVVAILAFIVALAAAWAISPPLPGHRAHPAGGFRRLSTSEANHPVGAPGTRRHARPGPAMRLLCGGSRMARSPADRDAGHLYGALVRGLRHSLCDPRRRVGPPDRCLLAACGDRKPAGRKGCRRNARSGVLCSYDPFLNLASRHRVRSPVHPHRRSLSLATSTPASGELRLLSCECRVGMRRLPRHSAVSSFPSGVMRIVVGMSGSSERFTVSGS